MQNATTLSAIRRFSAILHDSWRSPSLIYSQVRQGTPNKEAAHPVMQAWAQRILEYLQIRIRQVGTPVTDRPILFVGSHSSYVDIPVLMSAAPVVFVAKQQILKWPVFGRACASVGTVFVERGCKDSRKQAAESLGPQMLNNSQSVVIFPSGTTTLEEEKPWRWGAFTIAKRYGIEVQPFRLYYDPPRRIAYLGDDNFVTHLWRLLITDGAKAHLHFGEPRSITDPEKECASLHEWVRAGLPRSS